MVSARTEDNRGREGMQRAPTYRDTKTRLVVGERGLRRKGKAIG